MKNQNQAYLYLAIALGSGTFLTALACLQGPDDGAREKYRGGSETLHSGVAGCSSHVLTDPIESSLRRCSIQVRQKEHCMTPDPAGNQEPEKARFHFPKGQSVHIVEGAFTEYIGTVSESDVEQQKVTVLISFFGRPTPVVLDFLQVEKIDLLMS
jgi:hypothetical protein